MSKQMSGVINSHWTENDWNPASMTGIFTYDGMEIMYQMGGVPAYCGAHFIYDFIYNSELSTVYDVMRGQRRFATDEDKKVAKRRLREFFRRFKFHLGVHLAKGKSSNVDWPAYNGYDREYYARPYDMQCTFWEVEQRPMYFGGEVMSGKKARPVINPNSGNTAAFFSFPFDGEYYERMYKKHGTKWCTFEYHAVRNYPYDIREEGGEDDIDFGEDW